MTKRPIRSLAGAVAALCAAVALAGPAPLPGYADPVPDAQWQLSALDAPAAWSRSTGAGVVVAVLDSGVDADHPDLAGRVLAGADFVDGTTDGHTDPVGHGTAVAGLIAGQPAGPAGVEGIAPDAEILPVRVLDAQNRYADAATVAEGLRWAVDHGAGVVNLSLGGEVRSDALAAAIGYAYAHDVVVVACTGNRMAGAPTDVWYPAREPGVLAVAGLTPAGPTDPAGPGAGVTLWSGGLTGPDTVLTAPATNLQAAKPDGYWRVEGTSFAAPLVAGAAALIRARWPTMDAADVVNRLIRTADDLGPAGRDPRYGYGEVDPVRALTATGIRPVTSNPLLTSAAGEPSATSGRPAAGAGGPVPGGPTRGGPARGGPTLGGTVPGGAARDGAGRGGPAPGGTARPPGPAALAALAVGSRGWVGWILVACAGILAGTLGAGLITRRRRTTGR